MGDHGSAFGLCVCSSPHEPGLATRTIRGPAKSEEPWPLPVAVASLQGERSEGDDKESAVWTCILGIPNSNHTK